MKTAVSLPDDLFAAAESVAQRRGMSRSRLYATALREFLEAHDTDLVRERLNQVYASESSRLDPALYHAQLSVLDPEDW